MSDKDILLCRVEHNKENFYIPFGLLYLADALENEGYNVDIWHDTQDNLDDFYSNLEKLEPLFVGFNTITGSHLIPTISASKKSKELGFPVVWGGVHATILPKLCASQKYVDYVVLVEGEETITEFANNLKENQNPKEAVKKIKGLAFCKDGNFVNTGRRKFVDLDKYFPALEKIDLSRYFRERLGQKKVLPIITSRGCPFRCAFCYNTYFNKSTWREHSIDSVMKQVNYFKSEYSIDGIAFYDDFFFGKKERAKKIIKKVNLPFFAESRADMINKNFSRFLERNGCREILIGAESGSDRVLGRINKGFSVSDIREAVKALNDTTITPFLSFIIGFPDERKEDRDKTSNFIRELKEINPNVKYELNLYTPYPGTALWSRAVEEFDPPSSNEEWGKFTISELSETPWCTREELIARDIYSAMSVGDSDELTRDSFLKSLLNFMSPLLSSDMILKNPFLMKTVGRVSLFVYRIRQYFRE